MELSKNIRYYSKMTKFCMGEQRQSNARLTDEGTNPELIEEIHEVHLHVKKENGLILNQKSVLV